jgi:ankyrin repeat domain-containing protein 50
MVCYFFFKEDFLNQRSSFRALCALLHQLFDSNRYLIIDGLLEKYGGYGKEFVKSFSDMWSIFLDAAAYQGIICVLDALDEC